MPFYEHQPIIYPLHRLLEEVLTGEVQVPRFQRPGTESTWKPQQRGELLDSIYRGFPIGTILLWSTGESVQTLPVVGGARVNRRTEAGRRLRLILDGHQRLSTLVKLLGPGIDVYRPAPAEKSTAGTEPPLRETWVFDAAGEDDDTETRFKLLRIGERPIGKQVPLDIALDRVKLNEWVRKQKSLTRYETRRVDSLRDRLREFSIPVATLAAESLAEATETFKRVNSSGTPMSDFHMVSALAYTDGFDPQEEFEKVRDELLEPEGWNDLDDADLLRICAGLVRAKGDASQHPAKLDIAGLGKALRNDTSLIAEAGRAAASAAATLRRAVGVHGAETLPYSWQLIILAIELGRRPRPQLRPKEVTHFARWFWLTTYGGVFAGVNSAIVDRAARALHDMLDGDVETAMQLDIGRRVEEPGRFDFRAARARACLLAMARDQDEGALDGPAHQALARGSKSVQTLNPKAGRSLWFNLVIETDGEKLKSLRDALRHRAAGQKQPSELEQLAAVAINRSAIGDVGALLGHRRENLLAKEKRFVETLGLDWREPSNR